MQRLWIIGLLCTLLTGATWAAKNDGSSCERAIEISNNYQATIPSAGDYWYTAWTYDLPIEVTFTPPVGSTCPKAFVDFSCTGIYEDSLLNNLLNGEGAVVQTPIEIKLDSVMNDGVKSYHLLIGTHYRDMMTRVGLTRNVQAFVRVHTDASGSLNVVTDADGSYCREHSILVKAGDTLQIAANDSTTKYILPFGAWRTDSIRFVWQGSTEPVHLHLATDPCDYELGDTDANMVCHYIIDAADTLKLSARQISDSISAWGGGFYYTRIISHNAAKLIVEKIPMQEIASGTTLLRYNRTQTLPLNDTTVYAIYSSWQSTQFVSPTEHMIGMYVGATPAIDTADATTYLDYFQFNVNEYGTHYLQLSNRDMQALADHATGDYLYIRFACQAATTITPMVWEDNDCGASTTLIRSGESMPISSYATSHLLRMSYPEWRYHNASIKWSGSAQATVYIYSTCNISANFANDTNQVAKPISIRARGTTNLTPTAMNTWGQRMSDADSLVYIMVYSGKDGTVTFTSSRPQEQEPTIEDTYQHLSFHVACEASTDLTTNIVYVVTTAKPQNFVLTLPDGTSVRTWFQQPDERYILPTNLPAGQYILRGSVTDATVTITIE